METSTFLQLVREVADSLGCHIKGTSTDAATTSLTVADYPLQTARTNASNITYEGPELYLSVAQASYTIATTDLSATGTSFSVADGSGFAASTSRPYIVGVDSELIMVTRSTNTFTVLSGGRGWGGTRAAIHAIGATVYGPTLTPNPNGIAAYVASTGVLTPSVTWISDPGTTVLFDIFSRGVSIWDLRLAVNRALRNLTWNTKSPLTLVADGDMALDGISNWTAYGTLNASSGKVTNANAIRGPRSLLALASAANSGYQSATILVDPTNAGPWYVQALVRAQIGTATLRPYDVTNSANIAVSGTQTWALRGWGLINLTFNLPATCEALAFRLESTANADRIFWQYVAAFPIGARDLALPSWVERQSQVLDVLEDIQGSFRYDTPNWVSRAGHDKVYEDLANPNNQVRIKLAEPMTAKPLWLDAVRGYPPMAGDAQSAYVDRDHLVAAATMELCKIMSQGAASEDTKGWRAEYRDRLRALRVANRANGHGTVYEVAMPESY